jgi:hypothetical protein
MPFNLNGHVTNTGNGNATPPDPLLINTVQVGYTPTVTGNTTDNNRVVSTSDRNDLYFVDNQGNSVMLERNLPTHLTPDVAMGELFRRKWDKTAFIAQNLDPLDPVTWSYSMQIEHILCVRHKEVGIMKHLTGEHIQMWLYHFSKTKGKKRTRDRTNHTNFANINYPYKNRFVHTQELLGNGGTPSGWTNINAGSIGLNHIQTYKLANEEFNEGERKEFVINPARLFRTPTGVDFPIRADDYLNAGIEPRGRKKSKPKPTRFSAAVLKIAFVIPNYKNTNKPLWLGESDPVYIYPKMKKFLNTSTNEVEKWCVQWQIDIGKRTM